jgi:hypothetical protein
MRAAGQVSAINHFARWRTRMLYAAGCASKGERCCTALIEERPLAVLKESPMSPHKFSTGQVVEARTGLWAAPAGAYEIIRRLPPSDSETDTASNWSTTATSESSRRAILQMTSFERARRQVPYLRYATPGFTTGHFASGMVAADPDSRTTESRTGGAPLLGLPPRIGSTIVHHRGL